MALVRKMEDTDLLEVSIWKQGKSYLVKPRGFGADAVASATWKRTLAKMAQDRVIFDQAAGKELIEKKGDPIVYEVINLWKFAPKIAELGRKSGIACDLTIINYGVISTSGNGELFCTYGHGHEKRLGEIYSVLAGKASLIMYLPGSNLTRVVRMGKGDECYIPPDWVHRTCCGDEGVVLAGFVPHAAGHDYEAVRALGFPYHVFYDEKGGKVSYKRNPRFENASLETVDAEGSLGAVKKFFTEPLELKIMLEKEA